MNNQIPFERKTIGGNNQCIKSTHIILTGAPKLQENDMLAEVKFNHKERSIEAKLVGKVIFQVGPTSVNVGGLETTKFTNSFFLTTTSDTKVYVHADYINEAKHLMKELLIEKALEDFRGARSIMRHQRNILDSIKNMELSNA
ncbi:hypothetical protein GR28A_00103 [Vibrio phage vB_VcorM_GR28A]|nr:hypothetical protein GR28A_00103 [Vibrio phage vB_VcorM_GR28A]